MAIFGGCAASDDDGPAPRIRCAADAAPRAPRYAAALRQAAPCAVGDDAAAAATATPSRAAVARAQTRAAAALAGRVRERRAAAAAARSIDLGRRGSARQPTLYSARPTADATANARDSPVHAAPVHAAPPPARARPRAPAEAATRLRNRRDAPPPPPPVDDGAANDGTSIYSDGDARPHALGRADAPPVPAPAPEPPSPTSAASPRAYGDCGGYGYGARVETARPSTAKRPTPRRADPVALFSERQADWQRQQAAARARRRRPQIHADRAEARGTF
ncbi:hypothetical protein M885DRAFT_510043 [Pelagophyceae sp. CCMP2097]|nr:hypothetical protein M885DRAFT_510043 [Pelagophyceae sp. CCMP2097]